MSAEERRAKPRLSDEEIADAVPPTPRAREFRVGVFVILGIVGFFTVLFLMTSPAMFRGRYMVATLVDDAQGIRRGDPVRMRGINVGRVHRFDLHPEGGVTITLEVEGEWPIPEGSRTELLSMGVLGGMVVSVIPGAGERTVGPGDVLPGTSSGGVLASADDLAADAADVFDRVRRLLSDSAVAGAGDAVLQLRDVLADVRAVTEGQADEVRALLASLRRSAQNVEAATGAKEWSRTAAKAEVALDRLDATAAAVDRSMASIQAIATRIENGQGTLGRLSVDESLYESLDDAAASLAALLDDVRANPGRYLKIEVF